MALKVFGIGETARRETIVFVQCDCKRSFWADLGLWIAFNAMSCPKCGKTDSYSNHRDKIKAMKEEKGK